MKINKKYLSIMVLTMILFSLSGCVKVTLKNQSEQIESTINEDAENSTKVDDATTEDDEDVIITGENSKIVKDNIPVEIPNSSVLEPNTEKANVNTSQDVFTSLFTFDIPTGYQLLEDEYNTNTSKMYILGKRGKVVASIYLNYVDTREFADDEVLQAYKNKIEAKYNVIGTSKVSHNGFDWDGYVGFLKEDATKKSYIHLSSYAGETVYIEFMCTDDYECALDVATLIKSFKCTEKEE